ncbi:hypothetical protein CR513_30554, partial [Mucuna pruriens]
MSSLLHKYGVVHRVATTYHPQTNDQGNQENTTKMTNPNWKDYSRLLEDALWEYRTAYQTPLGTSPYRIVFSKACHLPNIELTGQSSSAIWPTTKQESKGSSSCKNWTNSTWKPMRTLGSISRKKEFQVGQRVLLFNSRLKLIVVELKDEHTNNTFKVNGHQIKLFHEDQTPTVGETETISLMEPTPPDDTP